MVEVLIWLYPFQERGKGHPTLPRRRHSALTTPEKKHRKKSLLPLPGTMCLTNSPPLAAVVGTVPKEPLREAANTPPLGAGKFICGENRLYHADNLHVLAALAQDESIAGKIKLAYIDPPFATAAAFESRKQAHAYDDYLTGAAFVEALRERLIFIHHLLADDGSFYLHLDERMIFHLRLVLDEIFGESNFRNCITRKNATQKTTQERPMAILPTTFCFIPRPITTSGIVP